MVLEGAGPIFSVLAQDASYLAACTDDPRVLGGEITERLLRGIPPTVRDVA